jgi:hypothetical protein
VFVQARVDLRFLEDTLAADAGLHAGMETDAPFDPQRFFGIALFGFSNDIIEFNKH